MDKPSFRTSLLYETGLSGFLFLAFFWLITRFIEAIYTFGLLGVSIPPEVASAALLLMPLMLPLFPGLLSSRRALRTALLTGGLALCCQGISFLLAPRERMLVTGLGTGLILLCLPSLLKSGRLSGAGLGGGLVFSGLVDIALRSFNHGSDLMSGPLSIGLNLLVAVAGLVLLLTFQPGVSVASTTARSGRFWPTTVRYFGLTGALVLLYFGFTSPAVIARWTGGSYPWIQGALLGSLIIFGGLWLGMPRFRASLTPRVLYVWAALFVVCLAVALRSFQVSFPTNPTAFPLDVPQPGLLAYAALAAAVLLHPVIYASAARLGESLLQEDPTPRTLAGAAALASLFLLGMVLAHIFTTVYDYIPLVGPLFRDRFWLVIIFPGLIMGLALWFSCPPVLDLRRSSPLVAVVFVMALFPVLFTSAPGVTSQNEGLRVMTYNIQQGYNTQGEKVYSELLSLIRAQSPDILGIQESDTARIANGNSDVVRYLADGLGMYSYYGPTSVTGTFGIALLSRYPIENPRTFFMFSRGEQTASILADIRARDKTYTVVVTHLGNDGPLIQQQQMLSRLDGRSNIIVMGDFNFNPSGEQYRQTMMVLTDAWVAAPVQHLPQPGYDISRRIDHVFLSPNLRSLSAAYLPEGLSDHPALVVDISP